MTTEQLMRMTVKSLRALAERHGLAGHRQMRKDELIGSLLPLTVGRTSKARSADNAAAKAEIMAAPPAGSSNTTSPSAPAPAPQRGPDPGLPIPDSYGHDRHVLLVQDPHHIFAYWEVSPATYAKVAHAAGNNAATVLVLHTLSGAEQREVDLRGGNYYMAVAPGATYRAEIALRSRNGKLHTLAISNFVETPSFGPSSCTDATWMEVDDAFHELLALTDLPGPDAGSLSRLSARTLDTKLLAADEAAVRGLSSVELTRKAKQYLDETLTSTRLSSTALSSSSLVKK